MAQILESSPRPETAPSEFAETAPFAFRQLTVQTTWRCTASCAMCYQSAGPNGSDQFGDAELSSAEISASLSDWAQIPMLEPHLHLVGGEALIDYDRTKEVIELARAAGFTTISLTTNGYWGRNRQTAKAICAGLKAAGLTRLSVSWDRWRRPFIPAEAMSTCIEEATAQGLPVCLRLLLSTEDTVESLLDDLRPSAVELVAEILPDTVAATGRAATKLRPSEVPKGRQLHAACFRDLSLTINPAGAVYPCCSGMDQTRSLSFGNIRDKPLPEIVRQMHASPLLRKIVFDGIASLLPLLSDRGERICQNQSSICSLCWSMFSDPEVVSELRTLYPDEGWVS